MTQFIDGDNMLRGPSMKDNLRVAIKHREAFTTSRLPKAFLGVARFPAICTILRYADCFA